MQSQESIFNDAWNWGKGAASDLNNSTSVGGVPVGAIATGGVLGAAGAGTGGIGAAQGVGGGAGIGGGGYTAGEGLGGGLNVLNDTHNVGGAMSGAATGYGVGKRLGRDSDGDGVDDGMQSGPGGAGGYGSGFNIPQPKQLNVDELMRAQTKQMEQDRSLAIRANMEGGARARVSPESALGRTADIQTRTAIAHELNQNKLKLEVEKYNASVNIDYYRQLAAQHERAADRAHDRSMAEYHTSEANKARASERKWLAEQAEKGRDEEILNSFFSKFGEAGTQAAMAGAGSGGAATNYSGNAGAAQSPPPPAKMDYSEYGGALLLGVDGRCIICHGSSSAKAIKNAIRVAAEFVERDVNKHILEESKASKKCVHW